MDVSALPEIRAAQRRHHRLVRRHGAAAAKSAVSTAADTWERSNSDGLGMTQWDRIRVLRADATSISQHDPVAFAVCYPEIIMIAGVLASPHWRAIAAAPFADRSAYTEINRRLRETGEPFGNIWPTKRHPLTYWAEGLRLDKQRREYAENPASWPRASAARSGSAAAL